MVGTTVHDTLMERVMALAEKGWGFVNPNPMVGAVIVKDGRVIAEGYHHFFGASHAEVDALSKATESTKGASLYVNLEPCSHHRKTPPCVEAIINAGIKEVFIACVDPNPLVAGRGISLLKEAEINVVLGIKETAARELNKFFFHFITTSTPYVILKIAMTLDGKIASHTGDSRWISGEESRKKVHELRHAMMGVMVGVGTVLKDNPRLNCRQIENPKQPIKIIVDSRLRTPMDASIFKGEAKDKIIVATTKKAEKGRIHMYEDMGAEVVIIGDEKVHLSHLMRRLGKSEIDSILLEGGVTLNASALQEGIVHEVWNFIAPKIIGGYAPTPIGGEGIQLLKDAYLLKNMTIEPSGADYLFKAFIER